MSWEPRPDGSMHARQLGPNCFWWHPVLPNAARGLPDADKMVTQPRYTAPQVDLVSGTCPEEVNERLQVALAVPGRVLLSLEHIQVRQSPHAAWYSVSFMYQDLLRAPAPAPDPEDIVLPVPD